MFNPFYDEKRETELREVIKKISQAISEDENNPKHYFNRALQYYQLSQQYYDISEYFIVGDEELYFEYVNKAYNDVEKALSFKQEIDDYAYSFKLMMLMKLKKWQELVDYGMELYDSIGLRDTDVILWGEGYFNLNEFQKCIDCYSHILEKTAEKDIKRLGFYVLAERGIAYSNLEQYDLAIEDFKLHLKLYPSSPFFKYDVYKLLAYAYEKTEKYEQALKYYTKSIDESPKNHSTYFDRGHVYCDMLHRYAEATVDYEKAIELAKDEAPQIYYSFCGYSYVHKGELNEGIDNNLALKDYERAIYMYDIAYKTEESRKYTVGYATDLRDELIKKMQDSGEIKI